MDEEQQIGNGIADNIEEDPDEYTNKAFPTALKAISDESGSWAFAITGELQGKVEYKVLREKTYIHWQSILYRVLAVTDTAAWRITMLFLIVANYLFSSYSFFFARKEELPTDSRIIIMSCNVVYFADYFAAVVTYFWKSLQLRLVNQPRTRATLIFDAFLIFPYSDIYELFNENETTIFYIFVSIPFLRLFHLPRFFRTKSETAGIEHWKYNLMEYFCYFILITHTMAWVLYWTACPVGCKKVGDWISTMTDIAYTLSFEHEYYIRCVYFSILNITNCGFGDTIPGSFMTAIVTSVGMFLGYLLSTGYFTGSLTSIFVNKSRRKAYLRKQVAAIIHHLKEICMRNAIKKFLSYYQMLWVKKKGVREAEDFILLPLPLQMEICYDVNICLFNCSLLLRNKPEAFLRTLSLLMKHEFYQTGDMIYYQHVIKNKMVCVSSGVVEILSEEDNQSPIISFGAGSVIGEAALILTLPAKASMRAATYTELQVLYRKDFMNMILLYPDIFANLHLMINDRIKDHKRDRADVEEDLSSVHLSLFASYQTKSSAIKKLKTRLNPKKAFSIDRSERFYYKALPLYRFSKNLKRIRKKYFCMRENFPYILQPNTTLTWAWEIVVVINTFLIGITYPLFISYYPKFPTWFDHVSKIMEMVNVFDIYVILTTAVYRRDGVLLTMRKILNFRLSTLGFYLDVFCTFHIELIYYVFNIHSAHAYYIMKFNRLLKLYRICKFFDHLEESLTANIVSIRLIKYPLYLTYIPYLFGSFLYLQSCYRSCKPDGWFNQKIVSERKNNITQPLTQYPVYISVYYALTCMGAIGYGDIRAGTKADLIIVCIGLVIGFLTFGYCIAEFSAIFTHNLKLKTDFQEALFSLNNFMKEKGMCHSIKKRIEDFFLLQWYYNEGIEVLTQNSIFFNTPEHMRQEVMVTERLETLMKTEFFASTDEDFVQWLAENLRVIVLPPNEVVCYAGGRAREMCIIHQGFCSLMLENGSNEILGPGSQFGIFPLLYNTPFMASLTTVTHVKVLFIDWAVLQRALSMFPIVAKELQEVCAELKEQVAEVTNDKLNFVRGSTEEHDDNYYHITKIAPSKSFVHVLRHCRRTGENYWAPFNSLGQMRWLRFLILPICILPDGIFLKIWVVLRLIIALVISILVNLQNTQRPFFVLLPMLNTLEVITALDLYLMMHVGYYGHQNQLIIHPVKTAGHYLKGLFVVDFITCIPWMEVLVNFTSFDKYKYDLHIFSCLVRFLQVFQVYRLPKYFQYLEMDIRRKGEILEMLKFIPLSIILIMCWATIVCVTSCQYYFMPDMMGMEDKPAGYQKHQTKEYAMICRGDSWIERSLFSGTTNPLIVFMVAFYWCSSTVTGTGFGDITAVDINHLIISMAMIVSGVLFFCYIFASISSHQAGYQSYLTYYQEMVKELKHFMVQENVPSSMRKDIMSYIEYKWRRTRGREPNEILGNLHTALHEDAVLFMYESTLRQVPLFEGVDNSFFKIIGKQFRERYLQKGDTVVKPSDVLRNVHIIYRGAVKVTSADGKSTAIMGIGGIFGNITTKAKYKTKISIVVTQNLDLLYLPADTFNNILEMYPEVRKNVETATSQHRDFIMPTTIILNHFDDHSELVPQKTISQFFSFRRSQKSSRALTKEDSVQHTEDATFADFLRPSKWFHISILPNSRFYYVYDTFNMLAAYVSVLLVTYQFAFQHHSSFLLFASVFLDLHFVFRIFIDMHKSYLDQTGTYVRDFKKIRARFFSNKKDRAIDFLANIPLSYLILPLKNFANVFMIFSILRLAILLRYYYVMQYFRIRSNELFANRLVLKISEMVLWIYLWIHLFACAFYTVACPLTHCKAKSWLTQYRRTIGGYTFRNTRASLYFFSVYFMVNILTTTGTGDIIAVNILEVLFVSFLMLATKFYTGLFIGDVTNVLNVYTSYMVNYEYGIEELRDYLSNENVSEHQLQKMWNYVQQLWIRSSGKQIPRIIGQLTFLKKSELLYEVYGKYLHKTYLFEGTEIPFMRQLCLHVRHTYFFPGNYIVQHGDSDQTMYFIHRGEVEILTVHSNLAETVHDVLQKGEMFGVVQGMDIGVPHYFSFRARTTVNIVSLQYSAWKYLLKFFPESKQRITKKAEELYNTM